MRDVPPPPPPKNSRKHPRYRMFASVELRAGEETLILPAHNISLGGVYLTADGHDLSGFSVGLEVAVLMFDVLDSAKKPLTLQARVVRQDPAGMALMWSADDPSAAMVLAKLLKGLQPAEK
jgi:hypothetical protein